ncbi:DUF3024 domain-containing protein [Halomonas salifodinae]|uniref:DUF3024 domain-containing protein n=1 Tax=Halomonas salifodinae TaxID=438745 RepID=UPI0033A126B2
MALSEFEIKRAEKAIQGFLETHRPPPHIRPRLDLGGRVDGQSVEIFSIRPRYDDPGTRMETPAAKATYVKSRGLWKVYWMRADLKWHPYDPQREVKSLEAFLALVGEDAHACFFG